MQNPKHNSHQNGDDEMEAGTERRGSTSRLTWLIAGVGIGALAGILLAPRSGEDTRDWISGKYDDGVDSVKAKVKRTRRRVGDWIDQGQEQVTDAVNAGGEALKRVVREVGT
jgi:gas vesicle protein